MLMLTREQAKERINKDIPCTDYLEKAPHGGYICPYCGSGTGKHKTGAVKYYRETNTCACHACPEPGQRARKFDVLDCIQVRNNCDYNTALQIGADILGITIEDNDDRKRHKAQKAPQRADKEKGRETPAEQPKAPQGAQEAAGMADYTDYYMECMQRLDDPAALSYLQARGISRETAEAHNLGYDPAADPANAPGATEGTYKPHPAPRLIIPVSKGDYVARRTDGRPEYKAMHPAGARAGIFNTRAVMRPEVVFVVEGAIDALSIMEAGGQAVALNSTNNAGTFIEKLKNIDVKCSFVISQDNDDAGRRAAATLETGLQGLNLKYITANICGDFKDPNDALTGDRAAFEQAVRDAQAKAEAAQAGALPGLMDYDSMIREFQEADDDIITIKPFPEFSKVAKIKKHSTVAIAADTGGGKSSLAINILNALNSEYPCIYFNLEMDRITVLRRLVAIYSGLEIDQIEGYKNDPNTEKAVNIFLQAITAREPLQIIQDIYSLEKIEAIIKASTEGRDKPTMVFIDHSLLVEIDARTAGRYERFTVVSEQLRKMALRYNVVLFVLLQQNRAGKADDEERPKNSSLKESGSWENDATHIVFLWYDPKAQRKKLLLTKHRGGDSGEFVLNYYKKTQTYTEAKDQGPAPAAAAGNQQRITKRDKARGKLQDAYNQAVIATNGAPTLRAMAEAADVTTATVKGWIKEYGGCTVDGQEIDPAGIDTAVEYTGFIRLTPGDDLPGQLDDAEAGKPKIAARF